MARMKAALVLGFRAMSLVALLAPVGCGSAERHLCERAEECGDISEGDIDECVSDLQDAIKNDEIGRDDTKECHRCMEDNSCGVDIAVDCNQECAGVWFYVLGSRIR